ncbi:MAG: hypothetical protein ACAH11_15945 [Sphingomonas sp.]
MSEPAPVAQDAPLPAEPAKPATAPETPAPATVAAQPTPPAPAEPAAPVQTAAAPAPPAPAQPATEQSQVAQIVNTEFGTYDKDGNGALDQTEFGTWVVALRVRAQPEFVPDSTEGKAWVAAAFKQADADKSASVNAAELTTFLTPKPAA